MRTVDLVESDCRIQRWGSWALLLMLTSSPLTAQVLPGQPRPEDRWEVERARYRALMLERVHVTLDAWLEAWNSDDSQALADLFSPEASAIVVSEVARGPAEIRALAETLLPKVGSLSFSLTDFDAGGSLAMVWGSFLYRSETDAGTGESVTGQLLTVLVEQNGKWRIRSQMFRPVHPTSSPSG